MSGVRSKHHAFRPVVGCDIGKLLPAYRAEQPLPDRGKGWTLGARRRYGEPGEIAAGGTAWREPDSAGLALRRAPTRSFRGSE